MKRVMMFSRFLMIIFITGVTLNICCAQAYDTGGNETKQSDFQWPEGKRMALSRSFDDARYSQADKGVPLLDKYGVKGSFYVLVNRVEKRLNTWKNAVKNGHDLGNHTLIHPCSGNFDWVREEKALENYTLHRMGNELDSANQAIYQLLGVTPVSFAFPCGQTYVGRGKNLKSYIPLVSAMFETGRGWNNEALNNPAKCDMGQLNSFSLDNKTFEEVLPLIESALEKGQWLIFAGHEVDDSGYQTSYLSTIEEICKYASDPENGIWIDNIHNIASYVKKQRNEVAFKPMLPYLNPTLPDAQRVEDLISRMTLEEKIGQLNIPCAYSKMLGITIEEKTNACKQFTKGVYEQGVGPGGGFFSLAHEILHNGPRQQAEFFNELQKIALEETRLGIPLFQIEEGTHGLMCSGGTVFPEGPSMGSTWNIGLIEKIYSTTAKEARKAGIHQLYTLVIEPIRDPRMGRNIEGYSEDPFMCSRIAEAIVKGTQGDDISSNDKVVAGLCHFPGQSQATSGLERNPMDISERELREIFLPPWEAGIKKAGALGVMATYPAIDGVPTHASEKILTKILREELGFEGIVLSEGNGFGTLVNEKTVKTQKEAAVKSINAGVDVGITYEPAYMMPLIENVKEGKVPMSKVDRAVKRVLELKFRMGLFENPFVNPDEAEAVSHTIENQELALQVAREGIVLLKNEGNLLPLDKKIKSIAIIGPNADDERNQLGDYTSKVITQDIVTVLEGIKNIVSENTRITHVKGCNVFRTDFNEIEKARKAAKKADVAIVVVGENERYAIDKNGNKVGTNGEHNDIANLDLTGLQKELIQAVYSTGTPTIVVLINGRPLSINWTAENIPAIVEAWIPGEKGGDAVADVLFGDYNPSGRLPVTFPRHSGQLPIYYNYNPSKRRITKSHWLGYVDMPISPLYEFGFGLSYTRFEYSNLRINQESEGLASNVYVSAEVKNIGKQKGEEVIQLYIDDVFSSVVTPYIELKGFEKIFLEPGEKKTVHFTLTSEDLSFINTDLKPVVEPGEFSIMVGSSCEDIRLNGSFIKE